MARDIDKIRAARRRWYERNKERAKQSTADRTQRLSKWMRVYKSTLKCEQCPESHPACLEFHHTDPNTKDLEVSVTIKYGWSISHILEEIAKCKVLCKNCHAKLHWAIDEEAHAC